MMLGGGMMLGLGLLMMLIIVGLPILLGIGVVAGLWGLSGRHDGPTVSPPMLGGAVSAASPARYCLHCGQGLQANWTHCPKCGAPVTG